MKHAVVEGAAVRTLDSQPRRFWWADHVFRACARPAHVRTSRFAHAHSLIHAAYRLVLVASIYQLGRTHSRSPAKGPRSSTGAHNPDNDGFAPKGIPHVNQVLATFRRSGIMRGSRGHRPRSGTGRRRADAATNRGNPRLLRTDRKHRACDVRGDVTDKQHDRWRIGIRRCRRRRWRNRR